MAPVPKPAVIPLRPAYKPVLSTAERAAYRAAHRIMMTDIPVTEWLCPGKRRSVTVDAIAAIIKEEFGK